MYIVKRTTCIPTADNNFAKDEAMYEIPCTQWRAMKPDGKVGHDSLWMRLHDLYSGKTDRAYWAARDGMDKGGINGVIVEW